MKKTSIAMFVLMFGICFQASAASVNSSQGAKQGQTDVQVETTQAGNAVQTDQQNKVMNQGEDTQIRTQEQNEITTQDGKAVSDEKGKSAKKSLEQTRSQVANAVQAMHQIAQRNGGIGQQVRVIAQNQNQNQVKLEQNIEKIQSRSGFVKFFVGPNYGEIKDAQKTLEQNKEQIRQLNQIKTQLTNEGDQQMLQEQISVLEQANEEIDALINESEKGFSLFGWLNNIIS